MSLSVRIRFEVFKRDRFTCQYCGRTPPAVLLEVDHIIPRAAGGSDDESNLTTSCWECNSGKSDRLLEEGTAPVVSREVTDRLADRIEQATAYTELVAQLQGVLERQVDMVIDHWAEVYGATIEERPDGSFWTFTVYGKFPDKHTVRRLLRRLPLEFLIEAVDITSGRIRSPKDDACRYFYGIGWREIEERRGR